MPKIWANVLPRLSQVLYLYIFTRKPGYDLSRTSLYAPPTFHKTFTSIKLSLSQNLHLHKTFTRYGLSRASLYAPPTFNKNFHFHKTFTRYGLSRASLYAPPDLVRFPDLLLSGNQTTPDLSHIENVGQTKVSDQTIVFTILLSKLLSFKCNPRI